MARPFLDPSVEHALVTSVRLTPKQKAEFAKRGGSAYMRQVLDAPLVPAHKVARAKKAAR